MPKIAFIFAGQGAQYIGMGRGLAEAYPAARDTFAAANRALGFDIERLCYEGPEEELAKTENTQPAILTVSVAALRVLQQAGLRPAALAGLSLGEYAALVAAEAMPFETAVTLVRKRGRFMQEAVPLGRGKMAAILGLGREAVRELCEKSKEFGLIEPANYNCPGQIVLAGETAAVERAVELAPDLGAKRAVLLPVSAPFHCRMLRPAGEKLAAELAGIPVLAPRLPVLSNVTADYVTTGESIKENLIKQVSSPVLWEDIVRRMLDEGITTFIEIGPGKALGGFVRKVSKEVVTYNAEAPDSLEKILAYWKEVC